MLVVDDGTNSNRENEVQCDVCIVGAGAAGIYLGTRLVENGLNVTILEAGGKICTDGESLGINSQFEGETYRGAIEGRAFGLGGTTSRWGGFLIPYSARDIDSSDKTTSEVWQHIVETVDQKSSVVRNVLGFTTKSFEVTNSRHFASSSIKKLFSSGLNVSIGEFLPFRRKNMAGLLRDSRRSRGRLTVLLNAVAAEWQVFPISNGASRLKSATCRGGKRVTVIADSFVLAAGTIESTRILLEIEQTTGSSPFRSGMAIGHYLGDHLSCPIAEVTRSDWNLAARLFAPEFVGGRMRNFYFLERSASPGAARSFAHFIFENENAGFQLAKKLLGAVQSKSLPRISFKELRAGANGFFALGWHRVVKSQLYFPSETPVHFQLDIEQCPRFNNSVQLGTQKDAFGRLIPIISWSLHDEDYDAIQMTANKLLLMWPRERKWIS